MNPYFITAAVSYLLGSIPFGYLLVRIFKGEDVRASGSGNIGATNVARKSPALELRLWRSMPPRDWLRFWWRGGCSADRIHS